MRTGICASQNAFLEQVKELEKAETLPPPTEVKFFLENNKKWLNELSSNPALGSSLTDLAKRIRKATTNEGGKDVADYVDKVAQDMRVSDELVAKIMHMSLSGASAEQKGAAALSSDIGRDEKARAEAAKINAERKGIGSFGKGTPDQAVEFVASLGSRLQYLDLTGIEVTSKHLVTIAKHCPEIRHLITDSSKLSDDVVTTISSLQKLEFLDLRGSSGISSLKLSDHNGLKD